MEGDRNKIRESVIQMLMEYPKLKQKIKLLRYELENPVTISADEMLESMCFAKGDGIGGGAGQVSNRTLYIAMNYQRNATEMNTEATKDILNRLLPLEWTVNKIDYYLSLLAENEQLVIRLLYFDKKQLSEAADKMQSSIWAVRRARDAAIDKLVEMYDFVNENG